MAYRSQKIATTNLVARGISVMSGRLNPKCMPVQSIAGVLLAVGFTFGTAHAQTYGQNPTPQPTPSASTGTGAGASSVVSLKVQTSSQGSYLVDSQGKSLYVFAADTTNNSTCNGACARVWPPFTVPQGQTAQAQTGITESQIGSITRSDGTQQVTYHGQPLYYYAQDQSPGQTNGQGISSFGALWYLVQPNGSPLLPSSAAGTAAAAGYNAGAAAGVTSGAAAGYGAGTSTGSVTGTSANCSYVMDTNGNVIFTGNCAGTSQNLPGCTYSFDVFGVLIPNGNCAGTAYNNGDVPIHR